MKLRTDVKVQLTEDADDDGGDGWGEVEVHPVPVVDKLGGARVLRGGEAQLGGGHGEGGVSALAGGGLEHRPSLVTDAGTGDLDSVFPRLVQAGAWLAAAAPPPGMILAEYCMVITSPPAPCPATGDSAFSQFFNQKTNRATLLLVILLLIWGLKIDFEA